MLNIDEFFDRYADYSAYPEDKNYMSKTKFMKVIGEITSSPVEPEVSPKVVATESECCECPEDKFIDFVRYCGNCNKRIKFDDERKN